MKKNKKQNKGITTAKYLRCELLKVGWTIKNKECYITGSTANLEVHHSGTSFKKLSIKAHRLTGIQYKPYASQYNRRDLKELKNKFLELHYKECEAITLNKEVHAELHKRYGRDVSKSELEEFKAVYINDKIKEIA